MDNREGIFWEEMCGKTDFIVFGIIGWLGFAKSLTIGLQITICLYV